MRLRSNAYSPHVNSRPNFTSDVHLVFTSMIGWMFTSESVWEMTTGRDDLSFSR